ncbi:signal transduction histidine kinase [Friedmanniella endophytica]|uniref:histidine kinase n=1 Tax=Microlunatus kandeliicorticis TaxID=1759536 RepID=A0A7W3IR80_9ACTN|nr:sensor histidine kinase [Microlunatus kandeliicorticis]MBA8793728.1 signal transduction histidine kinase [Microlunatus kandeliicorticis]
MSRVLPEAPAAHRRRSWFEIRDRRALVDAGLAFLAALICAAPYTSSNPWVMAGSLGLCGAVALRRRLPAVALVLAVASALGLVLVTDQPFTAILLVPVMVYSLARWSGQRLARWGLAAAVVGSVIAPIRWYWNTYDAGPHAWLIGSVTGLACLGLVGGPYLVGRRRQESLQQLAYRREAQAEQQRLLAAEQIQRSRAATVDERNRIARELHDIVAHSLSVIVVQAEGGKAIAARKPERAPEVLETIAETSREALAEMRQMVGLLRRGEMLDPVGRTVDGAAAEDYRPAPGVGDLPELVRKTTDRARYEVRGTVPPLPTAVGLTVYRIVQESLTNVLKHAGPQAHATVTLTALPDRLVVEVRDDGRGAAAPSDGQGHGVQGMRERAGLHGGTVQAGPAPGGGFLVRASVPLRTGQQPVPIPQRGRVA